MKSLLLVVLFAVALAGVANAGPFVYSPLGLQVDLGAGIKWDHSEQGPLQFQDQPWVSGALTKQMGGRFTLSGTFERVTVKEARYEVRAGVFYRLGP